MLLYFMNFIEKTIICVSTGNVKDAKNYLREAVLNGPGFEVLGRKLEIHPKSLMRMLSAQGIRILFRPYIHYLGYNSFRLYL